MRFAQRLGLLSEAMGAARKMRTLIVLLALLYAGSYLVGWYLISGNSPIALQTRESLGQAVLTQQPFTAILQSLQGGDLLTAVLITFIVNLVIGAFLTTTLPGVFPLLGALAVVAVTSLRGFVIGITYPEVLTSSSFAFVVGLGTLILELGAYVFSGAAGVNIAFAPLLPRRYGVRGRWTAFKMAWKDAARIFLIVVILLAAGAIWEMTGLLIMLS